MELSSDIVSNLERNKRTESGMRTFFQINAPQKHESNLDPHENKLLFLSTPQKRETSIQVKLSNLSEME